MVVGCVKVIGSGCGDEQSWLRDDGSVIRNYVSRRPHKIARRIERPAIKPETGLTWPNETRLPEDETSIDFS